MTAKEARELMLYKERFFPLITKAAIEGKDNIVIKEKLNRSFFESYGYKVDESCSRSIEDPQYLTKISW